MRVKLLGGLLSAMCIAACAGGGSSGITPAKPAPLPSAQSGNAIATLKILVPSPPPGTTARRRQFVSPSTAGLLAQVYAHSDTTHAHLLDQLAIDISSGSAACGGTTGAPRTCSVQVPAPPGDDDIVVTTYDQAPVAGSFTGANQLGSALVSGTTIVQGAANTLGFVLGGIISRIGVTATPNVLHGTIAGTLNVALTAFDADNNVIITDGYVDALGNPVSIALAESPNPALFTITPSTLSAPSTTPVVVTYNASASAPFTGTLTATAGAASGAATFTVRGPQAIEYSAGSTTGPYGIATGADNRLWYAEGYTNEIGAITTSGSLAQYSIPTSNAQPYGVAEGSDGRIWFAENGTGDIGAVTTSGAFTEYPVSSPGDTEQITEGPDGRIWCAEINSDNLCAVSTSGSVTTYPVVPAAANPSFITTGPDGNLWATVAAGGTSYIIAMSPSGTEVHEFAVPYGGAFLFGITAGPDGRLWFCDAANNAIEAVTTSGTFSKYPIPTGGVGPWSITSGPDGNLWFTEQNGGSVGRVTTSGVVTEFAIPSGASAGSYYITTGPDANLWFAEGLSSKIGTFEW